MKAASRTSASQPQSSTVPTLGEAFEDGTLIELIRKEHGSTELLLLLRQGKKQGIARVHRLAAGTYVPADLPTGLLRCTTLPARSADYRSPASLFGRLVELLRTRCGCEPREAKLAAYFALASHFSDCLDVPGSLGVFAAEEAAGRNLLRVLACLCRHPLPLADLRSAGMWNLPRGFCPTLLLSQSALSSATVSALRASQHRGFGVLQCDGVVDACCAKAILIDDNTPEELRRLCSVQIYLPPTQCAAAALDESTLRNIANCFQPILLQYRMENHAAVRRSTFDVPEFTGATRLAARIFGSCVANDPELEAGVVAVLKAQDESARGTRWMRLDSLVVEALLVPCHENKQAVHVGEVEKLVNMILEGRGESIKVKARKVGAVLRSLSLLSVRDNRGYGFLLSKETRRAIHQLGRALEVPTLKKGVDGCELCAEIAPDAGRK